MMRRVCFALDLVDDADLIAEYERAHTPQSIWPEVVAGIRHKGFVDMEIWRATDRLFMIATVAEDWPRMLNPSGQATDARWEAAMDRFQRPLPQAAEGEKWMPMTRIFALGDS